MHFLLVRVIGLFLAGAVLLFLPSCVGGGRDPLVAGSWGPTRQKADLRLLGMIASGDYPDVLAVTDSLMAVGIMDTRLMGQRALALGMLGREKEAVALFEQALLKDYENCETHLNFAVLLMKMGKTGRGLTEFKEAERFCGTSSEPLIKRNLAVANLKMGKEPEALKAVEDGLGLAPKDPYLLGLKGMLIARARPAMAESLFARALRTDEVSDEFLYQLGILFLTTGRPEQAVMPLAEYYGSKPRDKEAGLNYAEALLRSGRLKDAEIVLRGLRERNPGSDIDEKLAGVIYRMDRFSEALEIYESLADNPRIMDRRAMCLHNAGRDFEALEIQREVVSSRPDWPVGMINMAAILGSLGRLDEAQQLLEQVLAIDPDNATATVNLEMIRDARMKADNR